MDGTNWRRDPLAAAFPRTGGIGTHAFHVADGLCRLGVPVRVLCRAEHVTAQEAMAFDGGAPFPIVRYARKTSGVIGMFLQRRWLKAWCRRQQPSCLLASGRRAAWLVRAVAHDLKLPWLMMAYGSECLDADTRLAPTHPPVLDGRRRRHCDQSLHDGYSVTRLGVPPEKVRLCATLRRTGGPAGGPVGGGAAPPGGGLRASASCSPSGASATAKPRTLPSEPCLRS